jgi:hypothetical protein
MSNLHEPLIVNLLGHSAGAIVFGIFMYLLLRDRAGTRLRGSWLSVAAASLAFLWNIGSLSVLITSYASPENTRLLAALSFSVLSCLPAILLHLSLDPELWPFVAVGYGLSLTAVGMHLADLAYSGRNYLQHALFLITLGFSILTALSLLAVVLRKSEAGKARAPRVLGAMCSCLLAISFVHFGSGHPAHAWSSELVLHHAGIPLALFVLLQDYRFVLLDAFVRFLANVLVAATLTFVAIRITFRWIVADERISGNPLNQAALLLGLSLLLIGFAVVRGRIQEWLTDVVFRRPDLGTAVGEIEAQPITGEDEYEFLAWSTGFLGSFLQADRSECIPAQQLAHVSGFTGLMLPALASDLPHLRSYPEFAWIQVIAPLRGTQTDTFYFFFGRRRGGRRYLSEDLQSLNRLTSAVVARLERFRNSEMRRLVSQAELRALHAQINPHFLFNSLNALYGLIPREASGARKTVLNLAEIFRYFLRTDRTLIPLSGELEIVKCYLEIERLRLGPRLEVHIDVDETALQAEIPVLSVQPLVENAIKHGLAPKQGRGVLTLTAKVRDQTLFVEVADAGGGSALPSRARERSGSGVGLANVKKRLQLCFGAQCDLVVESILEGTRVHFKVPVGSVPRVATEPVTAK